MKKSVDKYIIRFLCITFFILFFGGAKANIKDIEDLDIYLGVASSLKKIGKDTVQYMVSTVSTKYNGNIALEEEVLEGKSSGSEVNRGVGETLGKTRENREKKISNQFFLGLSQVYIIDQPYAEFGIKPFLDILFKNPIINDNAFLVLCKTNSEEYYKFKIYGYENPAEYIVDMLKNAITFNFFNNEYTIKNAMLSVDSEGKNFVCPYINIGQQRVETKGMALFKKDKLAAIINMEETKVMNMLRENKGKGMLTIQKESKEFINYDARVKRNVQCTKTGDNFTFIINLKLNGDILNNSLYESLRGKPELIKNFEETMGKKVEKTCYEFINKMQNQYKVDCLQLGWIAAGKYGRDTGVDWNEIISSSKIKVNVKVKVDKIGRGKF